jgi:DNA-damage-inducible protein J
MAIETSAINIQINSEDKEQATNILADLGMNMNTFVNLAIKQLIKHEKIPFEISNPKPKKNLMEALIESEKIESEVSKNKKIGFKSVNSMLESIVND